jgi:hypothetical protein
MQHVWEGEKCVRGTMWKPEGNSRLEDLGVDGKILVNWILKNRIGGGFFWLTTGTSDGLL